MSNRAHGVLSLSLVGVGWMIAAVTVAQVAGVGMALGYLALCGAGALGIAYAYCAKCPCKRCCAHVLPGKLAELFDRRPGPYSKMEIEVVVLALVVILGLPQLWLWRYPWRLAAFWLLNGVAFVEIRAFVCRACENVHCPFIGR